MLVRNLLPIVALIIAGGAALNAESTVPPTIVVAADGTGDVRTVQEAILRVVKDESARTQRKAIRVKRGIYREKLVIPADAGPITLFGDDSAETILTFADAAGVIGNDGKKLGTSASASATILSQDFVAEDLTFQNAYGTGSQAVAVSTGGDRCVFRNCRFLGWQDTLLVRSGRHYFDRCFVEGHVDFIFGAGAAVFESCEVHCLADGFITAASTPETQVHGFVFLNCRITAEKGVRTYLGRPWQPFASVVFARTSMPEAIRREGWHNWDQPEREATARYAEWENRGPGSAAEGRVPWVKTSPVAANPPLDVRQILAGSDGWDPSTVPPVGPEASRRGGLSERVELLPESQKVPWREYLASSQRRLAADRLVLDEEMKQLGLSKANVPPSGGMFKIEAKPAEWFGSAEAIELATTVVSYQTPAGGWSKGLAFDQGPRPAGTHWSAQSSPENWHYVGTFDNRATTEPLLLLARVFQATGRAEYRDAFRRGLEYIYQAQYPSGGWPQVYPIEGGYHDGITFNDEAMIHILTLLRDVAGGRPEFSFVEDRDRAATAMARGVSCILACQISLNGRLSAWCAQHDPMSLAPVSARSKEPASISGGESIGIVRFLMKQPNPSPEEIRAVEGALRWFEEAKLVGWKREEREGKQTWVQGAEPSAPVWARFYDLGNGRPIFGGAQDGIVYDSFEAMSRANRFGYDFFTTKPVDLLGKDQTKWRQRIASESRSKSGLGAE